MSFHTLSSLPLTFKFLYDNPSISEAQVGRPLRNHHRDAIALPLLLLLSRDGPPRSRLHRQRVSSNSSRSEIGILFPEVKKPAVAISCSSNEDRRGNDPCHQRRKSLVRRLRLRGAACRQFPNRKRKKACHRLVFSVIVFVCVCARVMCACLMFTM